MNKDLIQLGFMLEREDRDWFTAKCKQKNLSAAYILSHYIKHLRTVDVLDPFNINSSSNKELTSSTNADINQIVNDSINNLLTPIKERLNKLEETVNSTVNNPQEQKDSSNTNTNSILIEIKEEQQEPLIKSQGIPSNASADSIKPASDLNHCSKTAEPAPEPLPREIVVEDLTNIGKKTGNAKLTEDQKATIIQLYRTTNQTTSTLGNMFKVEASTISRLLKKHIPPREYDDLIQQKRSKKRKVS
jgi:hypothetical protein